MNQPDILQETKLRKWLSQKIRLISKGIPTSNQKQHEVM